VDRSPWWCSWKWNWHWHWNWIRRSLPGQLRPRNVTSFWFLLGFKGKAKAFLVSSHNGHILKSLSVPGPKVFVYCPAGAIKPGVAPPEPVDHCPSGGGASEIGTLIYTIHLRNCATWSEEGLAIPEVLLCIRCTWWSMTAKPVECPAPYLCAWENIVWPQEQRRS